jgi:hypothetical protein
MSGQEKDSQDILETVSPSRRDFVNKSIKAGFVLPVVGSFTMSGLMATPAAAQCNQSVCPPSPPPPAPPP